MCRIYQVITLSKVNKKNQYLNKYGEKNGCFTCLSLTSTCTEVETIKSVVRALEYPRKKKT